MPSPIPKSGELGVSLTMRIIESTHHLPKVPAKAHLESSGMAAILLLENIEKVLLCIYKQSSCHYSVP